MLNYMSLNQEIIVDYIEKLVNIPSPTGFTGKLVDFLEQNAKEKGIKYEKTKKGAVIYKFESEKAESALMLASHIDTLGAMVKKVDKHKVKITPLGGYPALYIIGNYCKIHTYDGKVFDGTILPDNPAVHVNIKLKDTNPAFDNISIRVDSVPNEKDDEIGRYIKTGNYVTFDPHFQYLNGFVKSRHLDDKASAAILLHLSDILMKESSELKKNIYMFFNITEETGQGISGFPQHIEDLLIVDMGVVGEDCTGDEYNVSVCVKDSTGPYNYDFTRELIELCRDEQIKHNIDIFPFLPATTRRVM